MPKPRDEEEDLFHDESDVEFVDGEDKKPAKKRKTAKKTAKKKTVKKKAAKKKAAPKKKKKAAKKKVEEPETTETEASEDKPKRKRAARKVLPGSDVEIAPRKKKKPAAKKQGKASKGAFGAGLGFEQEASESAPAEAEEPTASKDPAASKEQPAKQPPADEAASAKENAAEASEPTDEYGRPEPPSNYVVHVYELGRLKRTIDRDFTAEMAEAYATEFSRAAKNCGRKAVAGKKDTQPATTLD